MMKNIYFIALLFTVCLFSCSSDNSIPNTLTEKEKSEGWTLLFNGKNLEGWHLYNNRIPRSAWVVSNGTIYCDSNSELDKADLVTNKEFENYELKFE